LKKIIVTGSTGYIGSHTLIDLIENGYTPISVDNESRSNAKILVGVENITHQKITHYKAELCDEAAVKAIFEAEGSISGIIHFAAYKTVPESVSHPLRYYRNNLVSLMNLLEAADSYRVPAFIFSSSCSVYGNVTQLPVTETTPLSPAESPYGNTKKIGEEMIRDFSKVSNAKYIALRYFNPVGAHPSGLIGELPLGKPENLMPLIIEAATGQRPHLSVFGSDYPTRDGTCIRDYVHVSDIAHAHTLAIGYLLHHEQAPAFDVLNMGNGNGVTVKELIDTFQEVNQVEVPFIFTHRRPGDVIAVYSDNTKTNKILNWNPRYTIRDICASAWAWEKFRLSFFNNEN